MLEKPSLKSLSPDSCDPKWIQVKFAAEVNDNEHCKLGGRGKREGVGRERRGERRRERSIGKETLSKNQ